MIGDGDKRSATAWVRYSIVRCTALLITLSGSAGIFSGAITSAAPAPAENEGWRLASRSGGILLYDRPRAGAAEKEFKAVGSIEAPPRVVQNVLNDVAAYPSFMPFTAECRIVKREGDVTYAYQRISPKIVSDRDYTVRIEQRSWSENGGTVYSSEWHQANEVGPAERKGILRVKVCEGAWLLEPDGAQRTRATYKIYTDTGGKLPGFIANAASGIAIRRLFAAIRSQVKDPKYQEVRDFLDTSTWRTGQPPGASLL